MELSDIIKRNAKALNKAIESPFDVETDLNRQKEQITKLLDDKAYTVNLGKDILIPKLNELPEHLQVKFNPFLAEVLLREANILLDRCLQQRLEYEELSTKWFEACLQIYELFLLNEITEREENENYDLPSQIVQLEQKTLEQEEALARSSKEKFDQLSKNFDDITKQLKAVNQKYTHLSTYATHGDRTSIYDEQKETPIKLILERFSKELTHLQRVEEKRRIDVQEEQLLGSINVARKKIEGIKEVLTLNESQAKFKKERNEVGRFVALSRAIALTKENGVLNYYEHMQPLKVRFQYDFWAAWLRITAAAEGFYKLYNYSIDEALFPVVNKNDGKWIEPYNINRNFDDLVTWCQYTSTWLSTFLDKQQQVTRSFSLRKLLNLQENDKFDFEDSMLSFRLTKDHFPNMDYIRLRGLAIQIDSGNNFGSWNVAVTPPVRAEFTPKDQSQIGILHLGRVNERTFAVVPESASPPKLFNASPIGEDSPSGRWYILIKEASTSGTKIETIKDIDIHLTLAVI